MRTLAGLAVLALLLPWAACGDSESKWGPPLAGDPDWVCPEPLRLETFERLDDRRVRDPRTGITFVPIDAGEFTMGGPSVFEQPKHRVRLTKSLWVAETETTVGQWNRLLEGRGAAARDGEESAPVGNVSWEDAQAFCRAFGYRLPTEAEWEYCCRAGVPDPEVVPPNQDVLPFGWFYLNAAGHAHSVGSARPNAWGLHDMLGNVWEWCADWYQDSYPGRDPAGVTVDPTGPAQSPRRSLRGGSWFSVPVPRASDRGFALPEQRSPMIGFRVVVERP